MLASPGDGVVDAAVLARGDRGGDELGLPAVAVWWRDQPARHLVGDGRAVVRANQVQAHVDRGG